MMSNPEVRRLASRAAANLVAVVAISAIFGLKAYINEHTPLAQKQDSGAPAFQLSKLP